MGVFGGVDLTDYTGLAQILDHMQAVNDRASRSCIDTIRLSVVPSRESDTITAPYDGVIRMKHLGGDLLFARVLVDLVVDNAVAAVVRIRHYQGVTIDTIGLDIDVNLIAHFDLLSLAEADLNGIFRRGVDLQMQAVDTIGIEHRRIAVFVLLDGTYGMRQVVVLMLDRSVLPMVRQLGLANDDTIFVQVRRINDQYQFLTVITAAFCFFLMDVCSGNGQRCVARFAAQTVVPYVGQLGVGDLYRVAQEQCCIKMHINPDYTVAAMQGR